MPQVAWPVEHLPTGHHSLVADLPMNGNFLKEPGGVKDSAGNKHTIYVEEGDDIKSIIEAAPAGSKVYILSGTHTFTDTINPPDGVEIEGENKHKTILNFKPSANNKAAFGWSAVDCLFKAHNFTLQYDDSVAGSPTWGCYGFSIKYVGSTKLFAVQLENLIITDFHSGIVWAGNKYKYTSMFLRNILCKSCSYAGFYGGGYHSLFTSITARSCGIGFYFSNQFATTVNMFETVDCSTGILVYSQSGESARYPGSLFTNGIIVRPTNAVWLRTTGSGTDLRRLHAPRITNVRINNCSGKMVACGGINNLGYIDGIVLENIEHLTGDEAGTSIVTPDYGLYINVASDIDFAKVFGCDFSAATTPVYIAAGANTNWSTCWKEVLI